ncbi:4-oxalocrotonate tautomerase DmpI [Clostridium sp. 'White wine YQ']|uniref:4-oxalocrotonate tautomerase DmpI n=1 Tax=Clostridium sp. 'White wine YQ' TaxID=3027474 RepID=UPI0023661B62|nr:4-oxalocrotonate tautomerase DmpI [Clostridium sp. 'White wine YQ']MDD7794488.1 tautomerase family protein [Clostridium sp. 'White wine YQ']
MPVIQLDGPKISKEQKEQLVKEFVTSASKILNIPEQAFVTVIKENDYDNIGNGTSLLSNLHK